MRTAYSTILIAVCIVTFPRVSRAEISFKLAPEPQTAQVTNSTKSSQSFSDQFSVLADWEAKIVAQVPQPIKDKFTEIEKVRIENAKKYAHMRDVAEQGTTVSAKTENAKDKTVVTITPPLGYYYYYALAVFFGYTYVFYGVILLGIFFVLRVILRSFNIIP
jgi:hypothetical protein